MSTLKDLLAQQDVLSKKIEELRQLEHSEAVSKARALIAEFALTQQDLFGDTRTMPKVKAAKVPAKYRDPVSSKEWSGRGLAPKWIQGKDKAQFLIA
jgi:DNA-binding protein H-NS